MKTRSQKRKEKKEKLAKTGRVIRLKKRLTRIHKKKCAEQQDSHMTAIMEAYILKRKAERKAERERLAAEAAAAAGGSEEGNPEGTSASLHQESNRSSASSSKVEGSRGAGANGVERQRMRSSRGGEDRASQGGSAASRSAKKTGRNHGNSDGNRKRANTRSLY